MYRVHVKNSDREKCKQAKLVKVFIDDKTAVFCAPVNMKAQVESRVSVAGTTFKVH